MSASADIDGDIDAEIDPVPEEELPAEADDLAADFPDEEPPPKKSPGKFLLMAIAVLAVLGGVVFYFLRAPAPGRSGPEFIPGAAAPPESTRTQNLEAPIESTAAPAESAPILPEAEQPAAPFPPEAMPPQPDPVALAEDFPPAETLGAEAPGMNSGPERPAAAAETDPLDDSLVWGNPPAPDTAPVEPPVDALTQQLQDGEAMPAVIIPSVDKTEVAPPPESAAPVVTEAEAEKLPTENEIALQAKVEELETQIGVMAETIDRLKKAAAAQKTARPAAAPKKAPRAASKPKAPAWVLKSAKPGMAWVSAGKSGAIRTVAVGDTLEGIGRITAIVKDSSGVWVVNGAKGRISQ